MTDHPTPRDRSVGRYLLGRAVLLAGVVLLCASLVFVYVHFGPAPPAEATAGDGGSMVEKKEAFGLDRPVWVQYGDYLSDMATLDFGDVWSSRWRTESVQKGPSDVNELVATHGARTLWLWGWTLLLALIVGLPLGLVLGVRSSQQDGPTPEPQRGGQGPARVGLVGSALLRAAPAILLAPLLHHLLLRSQSVFFGFNWTGWLVETGTLTGPLNLDELSVAAKIAVPPALALSIPFAATTVAVGRRAVLAAGASGHVDASHGLGFHPRRILRRDVLRTAVLPVATTLRRNAAALVGATIVVETVFSLKGAGRLFYLATGHGDYTTLQATLFLLFVFLAAVALLQDALVAGLGGARTSQDRQARVRWTNAETAQRDSADDTRATGGVLRAFRGRARDGTLLDRLRADPRPVLIWLVAGVVLFTLEAGAVLEALGAVLHVTPPDVPTLLDRSLLPNQGYHVPGEGWNGTAFGLSPALALALRVSLVGAYALAWVAWLVAGWRLYRARYRLPERTPTDAAFERFTSRPATLVALVVVASVFVTALFAPTMAATPVDRTGTHADLQQMPLSEPNGSAKLTYFDGELGETRTISVGLANMRVKSDGTAGTNVGPGSYDEYGRFHPFGTTGSGTDLYSEMVVGARVYAAIGGVGAVLVSLLALALALVAARLRGRVEAMIEALAKTTATLPVFVVLFLVLEGYDRDVLQSAPMTILVMAVLFGLLGWTDLWQTLRTPAYRTFDEGWRDSRRLVGRNVLGLGRGVRRLSGVVLAYTVSAFAGIVLTTTGFAAISATVWTTTRVWGDFYLYGIDSLSTVSGHTAVIPGIAVVVLIASAIVLADGIRAATETGVELGTAAPGEASALGGGG